MIIQLTIHYNTPTTVPGSVKNQSKMRSGLGLRTVDTTTSSIRPYIFFIKPVGVMHFQVLAQIVKGLKRKQWRSKTLGRCLSDTDYEVPFTRH